MKKVLTIMLVVVLVIAGALIYKNNTKKTYTDITIATSSEAEAIEMDSTT